MAKVATGSEHYSEENLRTTASEVSEEIAFALITLFYVKI